MDGFELNQDQIRLMVDGPGSDPRKKAAFKQVMSAFKFAYTAWEFAALKKSLIATGSLAWYCLRNVDEAARMCNCNKFVMTDKMQTISDWLYSKGMRGICGLVRNQDDTIVVEPKTAGQMMDQMGEYREAAIRMISLQASMSASAPRS